MSSTVGPQCVCGAPVDSVECNTRAHLRGPVAREATALTPAEMVAAIDGIPSADPEAAHGELDDLVLSAMPVEVQEAAKRLVARCRWWASA